jgi:hypothetical protein
VAYGRPSVLLRPGGPRDPQSEIGKGYEYAKNQVVAISDAELQDLPLPTAKVAIAKYAWSGRERLGLLRLSDDAIVLHAMRWPDGVRHSAAVDPPNGTVSQEEIEGALALIDRMTQDDIEGPSSPTPTPTPWRRSSRRSGKISPCPMPRSRSSRARSLISWPP